MLLSVPSQFLATYIPLLLNRFSLSYKKEFSCIEYFLYSKEKMVEISKALIVSHELFSNSIYVSKFYPEINKELNCKYLSAACFYLTTHHAVKTFHLPDNCCINLEAEIKVFNEFYSRLKDFDFRICYSRPSERVCLKGRYHEHPFSTDMITDCLQ